MTLERGQVDVVEKSKGRSRRVIFIDLARALAVSATLLSPFMPNKAAELWGQLGGPEDRPALQHLASLDPAGWSVRKGEILFPRADLAASS